MYITKNKEILKGELVRLVVKGQRIQLLLVDAVVAIKGYSKLHVTPVTSLQAFSLEYQLGRTCHVMELIDMDTNEISKLKIEGPDTDW